MDVGEIFDAISVNCTSVTGVRLGKPHAGPQPSRPRPLRVILNNQMDVYMVLSAARHLKQHNAFRNVSIDKFKPVDGTCISLLNVANHDIISDDDKLTFNCTDLALLEVLKACPISRCSPDGIHSIF